MDQAVPSTPPPPDAPPDMPAGPAPSPAAAQSPAAGPDAAGVPDAAGAAALTRSSVVRVVALALVGLAVVALAVHAAGSSVRSALEGLVEVHLWWLVPLLAAQAVSMSSLGRQQRALLAPDSQHRPGMRSVLRTTYAGNAISVSVPIAGPGLSTVFTYRRYTRAGARPGQVATGLAVSGVVSLSAFVAIIAVAAVASGRTTLLVGGLNALALSAVPVVLLVLVLHSAPLRERVVPPLAWVLRLVQRVVRRPRGDARELVAGAVRQLMEADLRPRQIATAVFFALVVDVADLATLGFALAATGVAVTVSASSWPLVVLAWAAGVTAAGVGLVPGGVGVVEVAITAVITVAGVPLSAALTGVLLYRIVAFWLVLAVGWVLVAVRRPSRGSRVAGT